jgi:hypothetical protein
VKGRGPGWVRVLFFEQRSGTNLLSLVSDYLYPVGT